MYATKATTARVGQGVKMSNVATCPTVVVSHIGLSLSTLVMPKAPQYTHGSLQQLWGKLLNFSNLGLRGPTSGVVAFGGVHARVARGLEGL